jgi:hypothetical protein
MLTNKFCFLNFFSMLNSFTQYRSQVPGFGAIDHFFLQWRVGQRKGPSGANAPPVHGIKKCLELTPKIESILKIYFLK